MVTDAQLDDFVATAETGIDCDGLVVERGEDGYAFEIPGERHEGLDEPALRSAGRENPWFVSNWHYWRCRDRPDAEVAFLRWLEDADDRGVRERYESLAGGLSRSWGQLRVEVELADDGCRRYALRHEDDAGAALETVDVYTDPFDLRELVKRDDCGRYRPLKSAPTLPSGWATVDLDGRTLVRAVDVVYPASVANWHLERGDELDVSNWRETMARQSGIYGVVQTWDRGEGHEHVDWVAEACCVDSQCLKRREWEYDDETDLSVDGGNGEFPCREPCSLVIAAARQWTKLEGEESRTYEFELTPSEKEQIEAIIDATADGRTGEIREADVYDGANRYRARFLRAKRFDEDGNLSGTPTDQESK